MLLSGLCWSTGGKSACAPVTRCGGQVVRRQPAKLLLAGSIPARTSKILSECHCEFPSWFRFPFQKCGCRWAELRSIVHHRAVELVSTPGGASPAPTNRFLRVATIRSRKNSGEGGA